MVRILYKDDRVERLVAPYGVYTSTTGKTNLTCTQIDNPSKPLDTGEPRFLEVGLMRSVRLTEDKFTPDARFDPFDARYKNNFICRI